MKIRILIAEDNENFGLMLLSYLRTNNYDVTWAKNGVQAMDEITKNRLGVAVVIDNSQIAGVITDGDLRRMLEKTVLIENITATDIMSHTPHLIDHQTLAVEAIDKMKQNEISHLVVTKDGGYYGILHIHELIKEGLI